MEEKQTDTQLRYGHNAFRVTAVWKKKYALTQWMA